MLSQGKKGLEVAMEAMVDKGEGDYHVHANGPKRMPGKTMEGIKPQRLTEEEGKSIILGFAQICERSAHKRNERSIPSVKKGT